MVNIGRAQTLDPGRNQGKGALWEQFGRWEDRQVCQRSAGVWETVARTRCLYCRPMDPDPKFRQPCYSADNPLGRR